MRFRQRHVHATIVDKLKRGLDDLGWVHAPVNFGTTPITILGYEPQQAGETPKPNTIAVSIEHQGADTQYELGGLATVDYTVFIDIYGETEPVGISLGEDIRDLIHQEAMPVMDYTSSAAGTPSDLWLEFENVIVENVPSTNSSMDKRSWRVVKATAVCFF